MGSRSSRPRDLGQELNDLKAQVRALMTGAMTRPAMRVEQGDFPVSGGGSVVVTGGGGIRIEDLGSIVAYHANDQPAVYFGKLLPASTYKSGLLLSDEAGAPFFWVTTMADGTTALVAKPKSATVDSQTVSIKGSTSVALTGPSKLSIDTPQLELYNLPTVATPTYALGYHNSGSTWSMRLVTSSRKYKADERPAEIDTDALLRIEPKTWLDKSDVEEDPDTTTRYFGVIAEDLVDLGLGDLLVSFVDGEPESVHYPQIAVALIPVVKQQAEEIAELKRQNEQILARLEVLETNKETP
jgi:hypothetical protein